MNRPWLQRLFPPSDRSLVKEARAKLSQRDQSDAATFAARYFPPEKQETARRILEITQRHSVVDLTGLLPSDRFVEDFNMDALDSMSLLELTLDLEKSFAISIPDAQAATVVNFGQLVDCVWTLANDHPSSPTR